MSQGQVNQADPAPQPGTAIAKWHWTLPAAGGALAVLAWIVWRTAQAGNLGFEKTLWNWLELIVAPLALASVVWFLGRADSQSEAREVARRDQSERVFRQTLSEREREATLRIENQRTVEAFLDFVSSQVLSKSDDAAKAEAQRVVLRTYVLEALDGLSGDEKKRRRAARFLQELELLKRRDKRAKPLNLEPLLCGAFLDGFDGLLINPEGHRVDDRLNLQHVDFSGCTMQECHLDGADMRGAWFTGSILPAAELRGAILTEACLMNATLNHAALAESYLEWADFSGSNLQNAILTGVKANGARFIGCDLTAANFCRADLTNARFDGAKLHRVVIDDQTQFEGKWRLVWEILNLDRQLPGGLGEPASELVGALDESAVRSGNLRGLDLSNAELSGAHLQEFDFTNCILCNTSLIDADLAGANLTGADITGADLTGADLTGADLAGAILAGARYTNEQLQTARNVTWREAS